MFCVKCGTQISDDSRYCPKCGANIGMGVNAADGQIIQNTGSGMNLGVIIAISAGAVLLIGGIVLGIVLMTRKPPDNESLKVADSVTEQEQISTDEKTIEKNTSEADGRETEPANNDASDEKVKEKDQDQGIEKAKEATIAYYSYLTENFGYDEFGGPGEGRRIVLFYLDDDVVPECYYENEEGILADHWLLSYDGNEVQNKVAGAWIELNEDRSVIYTGARGALSGSDIERYIDVKSMEDICSFLYVDGLEAEMAGLESSYTIGDNEVSSKEYNSKINSFGTFRDILEVCDVSGYEPTLSMEVAYERLTGEKIVLR